MPTNRYGTFEAPEPCTIADLINALPAHTTPTLAEVQAELDEMGFGKLVQRYDPHFVRKYPQQGRSLDKLMLIARCAEDILEEPELGINTFTTAQVAALAGVSIGGVYSYFENDTALLNFVRPDRQTIFIRDDKLDVIEDEHRKLLAAV